MLNSLWQNMSRQKRCGFAVNVFHIKLIASLHIAIVATEDTTTFALELSRHWKFRGNVQSVRNTTQKENNYSV